MHSLTHVEDLTQLRGRLSALRAQDSGLWGVMSVGEMLCHVRGAFRVAMGELPAEPISLSVPRAVLKAAALWTPVPWRHNFETVPTLKRGTDAMRTGDFEADRAEVLAELERFHEPEQRRVDHAFFGPMTYGDWMRWGWLHTDHHLRQFGR
jgi:hypothetical protein